MLRQALGRGICLKHSKEFCPASATRSLSSQHGYRDSATHGEPSSHSHSRPGSRDSRDTRTDTDYDSRPYKQPLYGSKHETSRRSTNLHDSKIFRPRRKDSPDSRKRHQSSDRHGRNHRGQDSQDLKPGQRRRDNLRNITGNLGGYLYDNYRPLPAPQRPAIAPLPQSDPYFNVLEALRIAFPHMKKPTSIQARFIPAIMEGHDVILNDETGSGKTFGSVMALLSELGEPHTGITTLYLVPHRDLAYQIESWCQQLLAAGKSTFISPSTLVRVLARPNVTNELLNSIQADPPRILITTPGALIEAIQEKRMSLPLTLRRIIIDEVDAVMKIPLRYGRRPKMHLRHRSEAAQFMDWILKAMWSQRVPKPQMVLMSATLRVHVRGWLFDQKGWLNERVVRIDGIKEKLESGELGSGSRAQVVHSAVVVESDGSLRDMKDEPVENMVPEEEEGAHGILMQDPEAILGTLDQIHRMAEAEIAQKTAGSHPTKGLTLPSSVLEAIATSVALDVTNRALLVVPTGIPVNPIVESFRGLGVDAHLLDFRGQIDHVSERPKPAIVETRSDSPSTQEPTAGSLSSESDGATEEGYEANPTLLVATTASIRGVDIPTLSHVYIVAGVASEESYRHIAGRTGRFGMPGTVISFVGAQGAESLVGGTSGERQLRKVYARIGVERVPFVHIL